MVLSTFVKGLLSKVETWIVLGFILLITACVYLYRENEANKHELAITKEKVQQNTLAWQDSTRKQADKMTILAAFVENLQDQVSKAKKEVVFWKSSYRHVIDSVKAHGDTTAVDGQDSVGKYKTVSFSGKQSIASYHGFVKVYLTPLSQATWLLNIGFDDILTASRLYREQSGIFYIETTSLTPSVKVIGYTALDSAAYPYLYGLNNKQLEKPSYSLYGGGLVDKQAVSLGLGLRTSEWLFLLNYRVFEKTPIPNAAWYDQIQIGIYHGIL